MKKFSIVSESVVTDSEVVKAIARLWDFLIYELGMRDIIENMLEPYSQTINFNSIPQYQLPLSLLYQTGKFPDIKLYESGRYWSPRINKIKQVRINGLWHPVNKLNTNTFDQAEILVDIFRNLGSLDSVKKIISNKYQLKKFLKKFFSENSIPDLMKRFGLKLAKYVTHNRINSGIGEQAESDICSYLETSGYEILYRGGDGDPIDMTYGCDIIVSKDNQIQTVQVKTKKISAVEASTKSYYSQIDLFYWSEGGNIGCVGGEDASTLF